MKKKSKIPPLKPYQAKDVIRIEKKGGKVLLSEDMGLGKSCIALTNRREYGPFNRPTIVICFASLKWNWQNECRLWGMRETMILEGRTPPAKMPSLSATRGKTVYIINYDILPWWVEWLQALKPGTVIIDESQAIKNHTSKRFKAARKITRKVPKILALTGTPIVNTAIDLWPTLNILKPSKYKSRQMFGTEYCRTKHTPWGVKFEGAKNEERLYEELKPIMIRRLKEDVLKDLPPLTRVIIPVDLPPKAMKVYQKAEQDYLRWLMTTAPHLAPSSRRMARAAKQMGLKRLAAELRLPFVEEWISNFVDNTKDKLIVFGWHVNLLQHLHEKYNDKSVLVNGTVLGRDKEVRFQTFKKKKWCRLCFGNLVSAGTGWNGAEASNVLFAEMGWTPKDHTQAEKRVDRIGQTVPTTSTYLIARGTIEETLCEINQRKQGYADKILDGKHDKNSFDVHDQLDLSIHKRNKK